MEQVEPVVQSDEDRKIAQAQERQLALTRLCIYKARLAALEQLIEEEKARLCLNMEAAGELKLITEEGTAKFRTSRAFFVKDKEKLRELLPLDMLLDFVKPTADLVDGAKRAKIDVDSCIGSRETRSFEVARTRTKAARERTEQIIEQTKKEASARADRIAKLILSNRNPGGSS